MKFDDDRVPPKLWVDHAMHVHACTVVSIDLNKQTNKAFKYTYKTTTNKAFKYTDYYCTEVLLKEPPLFLQRPDDH